MKKIWKEESLEENRKSNNNPRIIIVFFLALFTPSLKVNAHSYHHTQPMVDIIVRYSEKIPDGGELEPTYKNVRTSKNRPSRTNHRKKYTSLNHKR